MVFGISLIILMQLLGKSSMTVDSQMNQPKPVTAQKRNFHLHPIDIKLANKVRNRNPGLEKPWASGTGYRSMVISGGSSRYKIRQYRELLLHKIAAGYWS